MGESFETWQRLFSAVVPLGGRGGSARILMAPGRLGPRFQEPLMSKRAGGWSAQHGVMSSWGADLELRLKESRQYERLLSLPRVSFGLYPPISPTKLTHQPAHPKRLENSEDIHA